MSENPTTILIVEDEERIAEALCANLKQAGFCASHLGNGNDVISRLESQSIDLILLDVMLPGRDGLSLLREIRQRWPKLPVLMLTARVEEIDRLLGLELGADDYICKPFSPREVVARVRTVLRRSRPDHATDSSSMNNRICVGPVRLDRERYEVTVNQQPLSLTPKEFQLLEVMMRTPGRVFTRAQLLQLAYADDNDVSDRVIDSHLKNLRRKLNGMLPDKELIQAIYGVGYKLVF